MTNEIILTLGILVFTAFMFITEIVRIDVAAMITLLLLGWFNLVAIEELFSGFSSNAVISMMAVMVLGKGISKTGAMDGFAKFIIAKAKSSKEKLILLLSFAVGIMSGFVQNIGAASLFLPSMIEIAREKKLSPSQIIMPIGFCAIIGGTLTMIGSGPLLIANDLLLGQGYEPFFIFAVTPIGLSVLIVVAFTFYFFGNKFLPEKSVSSKIEEDYQKKLVEFYQIERNIANFVVSENSELIGKTIEEANFWVGKSLHVIALSDDDGINYIPWREKVIKKNQIITLMGDSNEIKGFAEKNDLKSIDKDIFPTDSEVGFVEVMISSRSNLVDKTIKEYNLRKTHGLEPIVMVSNQEVISDDMSNIPIKQGDTIILYGHLEKINQLRTNDDFIVATPIDYTFKDRANSKRAIFSFGLSLLLVLLGFSISLSFVTGALLLVISQTISVKELYEAIEWKVVFLVAALMPLGIAMENSGTASYLANSIFGFVVGSPSAIIFLMIAILSAFFSLFMSNVGAVVVLAPMILSISNLTGIDYRYALLLAAVSTANSFILPTHQVNALLMGAGGYSIKDYLKSGGLTSIIFLIVTVSIFSIVI